MKKIERSERSKQSEQRFEQSRSLLEREYSHATNPRRRKLIENAMRILAARRVAEHYEELGVEFTGPMKERRVVSELAEYLVYKASPSEMRALANLLELQEDKGVDKYRMALLDAYLAALVESDPRIHERAGRAMGVPPPYFIVTNPLDCIEHIQSPPSFRRVRQEFDKRYDLKPEPVLRKTLKSYGLPVSGKSGAPKGQPHIRASAKTLNFLRAHAE